MSSLTVNGGTFLFDLASPDSGGNVHDEIVVNGAANFSGSSALLPTTNSPPSGTYTILTSTGLSGTAPSVPSTTRSTYTLHFGDTVANTITLDVNSVPAKTIFWTGADSNDNTAWDINNHQNWTDGTITEKYFDLDTAVFDDAHNPSGNRNVLLNATVNPTAVTVNNSSGDYSISGNGTITGSTGLTKSGTSMLILSTANTYSVRTNIQNGTLQLGSSSALPSGTTVTLGSGSNSGVLDLAGNNPTIAGLATSGTGTANIVGNSGGSASTLTVNGGGTFSGVIQDVLGGGSGTVGLTVGGGSLILTGANTYTGPTVINSGATLSVGSGGTAACSARQRSPTTAPWPSIAATR